jgi:N6-L-threonylcarbamoyladenine synthase
VASTLILGIESSCDETAAAVVRDGRKVLANTIASQHDLHAKFGGVVPEIASRAHIERILPILSQTLEAADVGAEQIDAIAVGNRPGLIGSLLVGLSAAKALAWAWSKPLIGVDHVLAHLAAAGLDDEPVVYPSVGLVVSGGHTSLYAVHGPLETRRLGRTIDDAVGEAYDKVATILGLGFPGGPKVDRRAQHGDPTQHTLPRSMLGPDSLDFSFSGLKTAVLYAARGKPVGRGPDRTFPRSQEDLNEQERDDLAASFQAAAVDALIAKLGRAIDHMTALGETPGGLIIGGGVSANSLLRQRATELAEQRGLAIRLPAMAYCLDNAAMIAALGHYRFERGEVDELDLPAAPTTNL